MLQLENDDGIILKYSSLKDKEKKRLYDSILGELNIRRYTKHEISISPTGIMTCLCLDFYNTIQCDTAEDLIHRLVSMDEDANTVIRKQYCMVFKDIKVENINF